MGLPRHGKRRVRTSFHEHHESEVSLTSSVSAPTLPPGRRALEFFWKHLRASFKGGRDGSLEAQLLLQTSRSFGQHLVGLPRHGKRRVRTSFHVYFCFCLCIYLFFFWGGGGGGRIMMYDSMIVCFSWFRPWPRRGAKTKKISLARKQRVSF